jgi:hypothetical protein
MTENIRAPLIFTSPLTGGIPNVRAPLVFSQPVTGGAPDVRSSLIYAQPLTGGQPGVRAALIFLQALVPVEEPQMVDDRFPALPGLAWSVHKAPGFSTLTSKHASGRQTRSQLMAQPIWLFTLTFEFLRDRDVGQSDLNAILGLFVDMGGSFGSFLYQDASTPDFVITGGIQATADGVTLQWPLVRTLRNTPEPVGQLDTTRLASFLATAVNVTSNLVSAPAHGLKAGTGPVAVANAGALPTGLSAAVTYWLVVPDKDHFGFAISKTDALLGVLVDITAQGSGTNTVARDIAVYDNGTLLDKSAYSVLMPNQLVFVVAPTATHAITADFQFFYVCHFTSDSQDYEEFVSRLWTLQKCEFESEILP